MTDRVPDFLTSNLSQFWASNIKTVDNFLTADEIEDFRASFRDERGAGWYSDDGDIETRELFQTSLASGIINTRLTPFISAVFGKRLKIFVNPYMRTYKTGSQLFYHIDSEGENSHGALPLASYSDTEERCVTLIEYSANIYLNDDYDGGELVFHKLGVTLKPKAGQLIMFPCGAEYAHSVNRINLGERRTVVVFYTADKLRELYKFMQKYDAK